MRLRLLTSALAALLFLPLAVNAQSADSSLVLGRDFGAKLVSEAPPQGANALEKASWHISKQLTGRDFYRPVNYMFFRQAVREIGFFPAIFATADRILRDSKIGTATAELDADNPVIEEGPEAYAPGKREKK